VLEARPRRLTLPGRRGDGLVPAALYRYFRSKDALLAGLQRRAIAQIGAEMAEALGALPERHCSTQCRPLAAVGRAYARLPKRCRSRGTCLDHARSPKPLLSGHRGRRDGSGP